jgi:hypothetical protein
MSIDRSLKTNLDLVSEQTDQAALQTDERRAQKVGQGSRPVVAQVMAGVRKQAPARHPQPSRSPD